jgi:hypothetical protein
LINPYMDDTAEEMLTENQKPLEQLYHKFVFNLFSNLSFDPSLIFSPV